MSTRSNILVSIAGDPPDSDRVSYVYCHSDGYLEYTGHMLHTYYPTIEQARALVALGDLSIVRQCLAPEQGQYHTFDSPALNVTRAYGRDRGEKGVEPREGLSTDKLDDLPYAYYHNGYRWNVRIKSYDSGHLAAWEPLAAALEREGVL